MKDKRFKELYETYPKLFPEKFQIECNTGWLELIKLVCQHFQIRLDDEDVEKIQFAQIKEKFGLLRIYFNVSITNKKDDRIFWDLHNFISTIEAVSSIVCEDCGKIKNKNFEVKTRVPRTWWKRTLCDKCNKIDKQIWIKEEEQNVH